ncbi:MAG: hypothetical protein ACFCBW_04475 [Candidatus Competibacterales bacterium]
MAKQLKPNEIPWSVDTHSYRKDYEGRGKNYWQDDPLSYQAGKEKAEREFLAATFPRQYAKNNPFGSTGHTLA